MKKISIIVAINTLVFICNGMQWPKHSKVAKQQEKSEFKPVRIPAQYNVDDAELDAIVKKERERRDMLGLLNASKKDQKDELSGVVKKELSIRYPHVPSKQREVHADKVRQEIMEITIKQAMLSYFRQNYLSLADSEKIEDAQRWATLMNLIQNDALVFDAQGRLVESGKQEDNAHLL